MNIYQSSAVDAVTKLQSNEVDAHQLFEGQQARIQNRNSAFNAFVYVEKKPQATKLNGRLESSIKDQIYVAGMPCTRSYEPLKSHIPADKLLATAELIMNLLPRWNGWE